MKKVFALAACILIASFSFAQKFMAIDVDDPVYAILYDAEARGLCAPLATMRPWTKSYILSRLDEILDALDEEDDSYANRTEIAVIKMYQNKYKEGNDHFSAQSFRKSSEFKGVPLSIDIQNGEVTNVTGGIYSDSDRNSAGFESYYKFRFAGDLGNYFSYQMYGYVGATAMPLQQVTESPEDGDYYIGLWWFDEDRYAAEDSPEYQNYLNNKRWIHKYRDNNSLPYHSLKYWDGTVFPFKAFNNSGMEGFAQGASIAYGMQGALRFSFFDDMMWLSFGRYKRELGSMDKGASLVLNSNARPFIGVDTHINFFDIVKLGFVTGVLEYPNQEYITENAWNKSRVNNDAEYFQNAFSAVELSADISWFHLDIGSSAVWPKRYELGYSFPMNDKTIYQDAIGDFDNIALYADIKFTKKGVGSLWVSAYLDESNISAFSFTKTRTMFSVQGGGKAALPNVPFGYLSVRYTKVEPYCYTHHAINYTPWYENYVSEAYMNNGYPLGYYLQPNSDEFFVGFEMKPSAFSSLTATYQFVRHGADYGSRQVPGSNIYSEMDNKNREDLNKFFLMDGCYEWQNILSLSYNHDFNQFRVPINATFGLGFLYSFFTDTEEEIGTKASFNVIDTDEYPKTFGMVMSVGLKFWLND